MILGTMNHSMIPFDRARRVVLETLSNSVGTPPWANRRWKYFGEDAKKPVFGVLGADGFRGSGRRGYHSIELVEEYLEPVIGRVQVHEVQVQILCTQEMYLVLGFCRVLARSIVLSTDTEYKCT
jgi:hypothetical protein